MPLINRRASAGIAQGLDKAREGFLQGAQIGMRKRLIQNEEARWQREAMIADQELRREEEGRQAGGEAVEELARTEGAEFRTPSATNVKTEQEVEGPPTAETSAMQNEDDRITQRAGAIAKRMFQKGLKKEAFEFLDRTHAAHVAIKDHRDRDNLVKRIQVFMEGSNSYAKAPDGALVEDPEMAKAANKMAAKLADKKAGTAEVAQEFGNLQNAQIDSRTRQNHRDQMMQHYMQSATDALAAGSPDDPDRAAKTKALEGLIQWYGFNHDQIWKDDQAQANFDKRFQAATQGNVEILTDEGKPIEVPMRLAKTAMALFQSKAQQKAEIEGLRKQLLKAQTANTADLPSRTKEKQRLEAETANKKLKQAAREEKEKRATSLRGEALKNLRAQRGETGSVITPEELDAEMQATDPQAYAFLKWKKMTRDQRIAEAEKIKQGGGLPTIEEFRAWIEEGP